MIACDFVLFCAISCAIFARYFINLQPFGRFLTASPDATGVTPSTAESYPQPGPFGHPIARPLTSDCRSAHVRLQVRSRPITSAHVRSSSDPRPLFVRSASARRPMQVRSASDWPPDPRPLVVRCASDCRSDPRPIHVRSASARRPMRARCTSDLSSSARRPSIAFFRRYR